MPTKRTARRQDLGLTQAEFAVLQRLDTLEKIQAFVFGLGQNFELGGDTCRTVRAYRSWLRARCARSCRTVHPEARVIRSAPASGRLRAMCFTVAVS